MSIEIEVEDVEVDGIHYAVEASVEPEWEDDSFDHDWAGGGTEVCGHWDCGELGVSAWLVNEDGERTTEVKDEALLKRLGDAISGHIDSALENHEAPERDYECDDERDYYDD
jgi:hypothetical protein